MKASCEELLWTGLVRGLRANTFCLHPFLILLLLRLLLMLPSHHLTSHRTRKWGSDLTGNAILTKVPRAAAVPRSFNVYAAICYLNQRGNETLSCAPFKKVGGGTHQQDPLCIRVIQKMLEIILRLILKEEEEETIEIPRIRMTDDTSCCTNVWMNGHIHILGKICNRLKMLWKLKLYFWNHWTKLRLIRPQHVLGHSSLIFFWANIAGSKQSS